MRYIIWHDNDFDLALWTYTNSLLKKHDVEFRCIPKTNSPNQIQEYFKEKITRPVMNFIRFETPDLIIQEIEPENKVVCVTELMTHTPQWQHPAQRFTRLYTSTILGVPTALILPERKAKWEKGRNVDYKKTDYQCSGSVYNLFYKSTKKCNCPILIFHWPNKDGYLKYDQKHPTCPKKEGDIDDWFKFLNVCIKNNGKLEKRQYSSRLSSMKRSMENVTIDSFDTIEGMFTTMKFLKTYGIDKTKMTKVFLSNKKTIVFKPNGLVCSTSDFRTDPYAGMLCAFDVMFCRDNNFKRNVNLVFVAKGVDLNAVTYIENAHSDSECCFTNPKKKITTDHLERCSYTQPKYRRIYGEVADLVMFDDGTIMRRGEKL